MGAASLDSLVPMRAVGDALCRATGDERWLEFDTRLITGGKSNLTFRLVSEAGTFVLRRPPTGELLPSAHDMSREARVQMALASTKVPVPAVLLHDAGSIFGTPFYVMQDVSGHVVEHRLPPDFSTVDQAPELMTNALVDTLALLHTVDIEEVGLGDLGRPDGYLARQLNRWRRQWSATKTHEVREVDLLAAELETLLPPDDRPRVVHGDYRLDNCLIGPADPGTVAAVLDWEMATLGDPLADLGMLLFYWRHADEPAPAVTPAISRTPGFPRRPDIVRRYESATGLQVAGLIGFYEAFAHFKFAVITQGILARVRAGSMAGQEFGDLGPEVARIAASGRARLAEMD